MKEADYCVIIPTWNRVDDLVQVLDELAAQVTAGAFSYEVMVVDNNSTDATRATVKSRIPDYPVPLHYLCENRQGKSYAQNAGLLAARARVIVWTDDDVRLKNDWLSIIHKTFVDFNADGVGGPVEGWFVGKRPEWLGDALLRQVGTLNHGGRARVVTLEKEGFIGPNSAYRRELYEKLGGYDTYRLGNSEDIDFFHRALRAGYRLVYQPDLKVANKIDFSRWSYKTFKKRFWTQGRAIAYGVQEKQGSERRLFRAPLWMYRYLIELHFKALKSWISGRRQEAVWHWLERYFYLGAVYFCFQDFLRGKPASHERVLIPPVKKGAV